MGPKPVDERCDHDLFRTELVNLIDHRHDWSNSPNGLTDESSPTNGAWSSSPRLAAQHCPHG